MKYLFLTLLLLSFFTKAHACDQDEIKFIENGICAKINWIIGPTYNQFNEIQVILSENNNFRLNVIPWMVMSAHEHGSRPIVMTVITPTDYLIEKIYFMGGMQGLWYLRFQLLNEQNIVLEEVRSLVSL